MRNLTNTLLMESVADPSAMEAKIRAQVADRQLRHEEQNEARKLTPQERAAKQSRKFSETTVGNVTVNLYRVKSLNSPQVRFKVEKNAEQLNLSGIGIVTGGDFNIIAVEGGLKSLKKYARLLLHRIDWTAASGEGDKSTAMVSEDESDNQDTSETSNIATTVARQGAEYCELVWRGVVPRPSFRRFTLEHARSELAARKSLERAGVEQYWHLAKSQLPQDALIVP